MTRPSWLQAAIDKHVDRDLQAEERPARARLQSLARTDPVKFRAEKQARIAAREAAKADRPAKTAAKKSVKKPAS